MTVSTSLEEDLEEVFMRHGLQGFSSSYITRDNRIQVTSFGIEKEYLAYKLNKHFNGEY